MFFADVDIAHFATDRNDIFHASSENAHFASAFDCGFQNLRHAVHIAGKSGYDETSVGLAGNVQDFLGHFSFGNREVFDTGVRGVAHQ